jgi:hypothetical protein
MEAMRMTDCDRCEYVCNYRPHKRMGDVFTIIEQSDGVVSEPYDDSFSAAMNHGTVSVNEIFPLLDVSRKERELVIRGASFRRCSGYHDTLGGTRTRESFLRFRKMATGDMRNEEGAL